MRLTKFTRDHIGAFAMRRLIHSLAVLLFGLAVAGCATTKPLSQAAKDSIDQVSISDSVAVPRTWASDYGPIKFIHYNPFFVGGTFLTAGSGPLGDAILASGEWDENRQYAMFIKAAEIDVARMVRAEFESQIRQSSFFGQRLAETAKYTFELDVPHYSLMQTHTFSDYYKARIVVHAKLVGPDGEVLAEATGSSCLFHDCFSPNKLSDILVKPDLLREQYMLAARSAIQELLKSL